MNWEIITKAARDAGGEKPGDDDNGDHNRGEGLQSTAGEKREDLAEHVD